MFLGRLRSNYKDSNAKEEEVAVYTLLAHYLVTELAGE